MSKINHKRTKDRASRKKTTGGTMPIKSTAKTVDEIIVELRQSHIAERAGRAQDAGRGMEMLRKKGYM